MSLQKTILITGASSGVGAALAQAFAEHNTRLVLVARNEARLEMVAEACREAGAIVETKALDVTDTCAVETCISDIEQQGEIDIAIANAGILLSVDEPRMLEPVEMTLQQMETNFAGAVNVAVSAASCMRRRKKGQIALIASQAGLQPVSDLPGYSASKAAMVSYGEALGSFLKPDGVGVTVVCPGFITTPMLDGYKNFRPFEISAEKAATKIRKAIEQEKQLVTFPLMLSLIVRLGRMLPASLRYYATKPFNFVK